MECSTKLGWDLDEEHTRIVVITVKANLATWMSMFSLEINLIKAVRLNIYPISIQHSKDINKA
jgi:hypothetical protein